MEIPRYSTLFLVAGLALTAAPSLHAFGEEELPELPRDVMAFVQHTVFVQVEWIEVDLKDYAAMSFAHKGRFSSNRFREEIQALIDAGKAELKELAMVNTRSGQRAKTESIVEVIYPTEYDPGEVTAATGTERDEKGELKAQDFAPAEEKRFPPPGGYPNPTAFEMRPVGVTLEVDPIIGADGETIELNLAPEVVKLVGERVWQEPLIDGKPVPTVRQPDFHTMKVTTAITLTNGSYSFVDIQQAVDDEGVRIEGKKWLVFAKAWLEPIVPAAVEAALEGGELPE